ncbi:MAG: DegT/DnrJ/EryC1/StrS family aminotransferase [Candidatus Marinimicrobia bacterium]|nr:DegT/DnrJ/EryC1/StrS family aminotransferase [Candidatus Neomarinimicrobiota bacterium]
MATQRKVDFFRHPLGDEELSELKKVFDSTFLTKGPVTRQFEEALATYLDSDHVAGLNSCTAGLFLSLLAKGIGPGDEVITTPLSFIATANAVLQTGASVIFVDVEPHTGNIDAELIRGAITHKTKAIIPVHLYGQLCDMKRIRAIADKNGLFVLEDAAHALEASRDGVRVGELGDAACYSFYATKSIASGEGGAVSTDDPELNRRIQSLALHGMTAGAAERHNGTYKHYDMELLGYNLTMFDILAAMLLPQLDKISESLQRRKTLYKLYTDALNGLGNLDIPEIEPGSESAFHLFTIWVEQERRDELLLAFGTKGIGVTVNYRPIHLMQYYRERFGYKEGMFPESERIGASTISLPFYAGISEEDVEYLFNIMNELFS